MFEDKDFEAGTAKPSDKGQKKLTLKDQIRKATLKKMRKDNSDNSSNGSSSDNDSDDSDHEEAKNQSGAAKRAKESNLFTKLGVPQKEEEERLKREFKQ